MKFPIYLHKTDKGAFSGFVPDIDGCFFAGDNIDATIDDACAAIDAHLAFLAEEGVPFPEAKDISAHYADEDCQGGAWAYADIDLSKYDDRAVQIP